MEIITGYTGTPHITAEQDRDVNKGIFGEESYVLRTGSELEAELVSNNELKIRDGVIMHQGCAASIKKNTYDPITITNGSQGMKRIDLVVARYTRNSETKVESVDLKILQGTPTSYTPSAPAYVVGDIQAGDPVSDMPLYKITLNGLNVTSVEKMFSVIDGLPELNGKLYETYIDSVSNNICIRFPENRIQICAGSINVYATLTKNGTGYCGVSTKITQAEFVKPFKLLRSCTVTPNDGDWIIVLGKQMKESGFVQLRLGYFTEYSNKNFRMDYIAIGTY